MCGLRARLARCYQPALAAEGRPGAVVPASLQAVCFLRCRDDSTSRVLTQCQWSGGYACGYGSEQQEAFGAPCPGYVPTAWRSAVSLIGHAFCASHAAGFFSPSPHSTSTMAMRSAFALYQLFSVLAAVGVALLLLLSLPLFLCWRLW